jgi:hypothetical protein
MSSAGRITGAVLLDSSKVAAKVRVRGLTNATSGRARMPRNQTAVPAAEGLELAILGVLRERGEHAGDEPVFEPEDHQQRGQDRGEPQDETARDVPFVAVIPKRQAPHVVPLRHRAQSGNAIFDGSAWILAFELDEEAARPGVEPVISTSGVLRISSMTLLTGALPSTVSA